VLDNAFGSENKYKPSDYDVRRHELKHTARVFPPGHKDIERYLGAWEGKGYPTSMTVDTTAVLRAIHAEAGLELPNDNKVKFKECSNAPYDALEYQDGLGVQDDVVDLLDHKSKPRMLFYNGMEDLICNHVGNENVLMNLEWGSKEEWVTAERYAWNVVAKHGGNGRPLKGYMKEYDNLLFLKVLDSGHMVPLDLPFVSLEMMKTFLYGGSWRSFTQDLKGTVIDSSGGCDVDVDVDVDVPVVDADVDVDVDVDADIDSDVDAETETKDGVIECDEVECPICAPQPNNPPTPPLEQSTDSFDKVVLDDNTLPPLPQSKASNAESNNELMHNNEDIYDDTPPSEDDELTTITATETHTLPTNPSKENQNLLIGLLLGTAFGFILSIVVGKITRRWSSNGRDRVGYALGASEDSTRSFCDNKGYMDVP